jgi:hypothetical protein
MTTHQRVGYLGLSMSLVLFFITVWKQESIGGFGYLLYPFFLMVALFYSTYIKTGRLFAAFKWSLFVSTLIVLAGILQRLPALSN